MCPQQSGFKSGGLIGYTQFGVHAAGATLPSIKAVDQLKQAIVQE